MISLHNFQHSGFATIDYNNLFQLKVLCAFMQPRRQCGPLFSDSGLKIWCEEPEFSALLFWQTMLNGFLLLSRICLLFPASEEMTV